MIEIYVSLEGIQRNAAVRHAVDCLRIAGLTAHADTRDHDQGGLWLHRIGQLTNALDLLKASGFTVQNRLSFLI